MLQINPFGGLDVVAKRKIWRHCWGSNPGHLTHAQFLVIPAAHNKHNLYQNIKEYGLSEKHDKIKLSGA
jgi:hypothetical protein